MRRSPAASAVQLLGAPARQLRLDAALTMQARQCGWLLVESGQVWITGSGNAADHVLAAGEAIALGRGQAWVVEPWRAGGMAQLRWAAGAEMPASWPLAQVGALRPLPVAARPAATGLAWRSLAWALRGVAVRLAAAARNAESRASAAQGRICSADSIAPSGALQ
jgi:hypothetical protein